MVSHHPAKFGGHSHCVSGDIMALGCHVTLKELVTKGSRNFMDSSPTKVTILLTLVAIGTLEVEIRL